MRHGIDQVGNTSPPAPGKVRGGVPLPPGQETWDPPPLDIKPREPLHHGHQTWGPLPSGHQTWGTPATTIWWPILETYLPIWLNIWWSTLETFSDLFTWGLPPSDIRWWPYKRTYRPTGILLESYWNAFLNCYVH